MATVDGEGCDVEANAAAVSSDSLCENYSCTEDCDKNLSKKHVKNGDDAAGRDAVTCCQAADADAGECGSLHQCNEHTATDKESTDNSYSKLEERLQLSEAHETASDAATNEDDWMYVLGHDQLKKRACIMMDLFS